MVATCTKWVENKFSTFKFLTKLYGRYYKNIVGKEVELANIRENDRVLCIGGGSIPSTAIEIVSQTNALVDVIDTDDRAVEKAQKLIHNLGLNDKIRVYLKDGEKMDVRDYDVIHIALQVTPKEKVAQHIWDNLGDGGRMIIRTPKKFLKFLYSNISNKFISRKSQYVKDYSLKSKANTMDRLLVISKN